MTSLMLRKFACSTSYCGPHANCLIQLVTPGSGLSSLHYMHPCVTTHTGGNAILGNESNCTQKNQLIGLQGSCVVVSMCTCVCVQYCVEYDCARLMTSMRYTVLCNLPPKHHAVTSWFLVPIPYYTLQSPTWYWNGRFSGATRHLMCCNYVSDCSV